jgi:hypothetical protein
MAKKKQKPVEKQVPPVAKPMDDPKPPPPFPPHPNKV